MRGLPPFFPLRRAAAAFFFDFDFPPLRPRIAAASDALKRSLRGRCAGSGE